MGISRCRRLTSAWSLLLGLFALIVADPAVAVAAEPPLVAVHAFGVTPELEKAGVGGWWAAERMESLLARSNAFRVVTRALIAKVMKERNLNAGPELKPEALARIAGAEYLVSGRIDLSGGRMTVTASLISVAARTGEIARSTEDRKSVV